ncbi:MAG: hypothetical protein H6696_09670 [Deferribacteres bacterium]|nr:hypothetical protein [candidate division KSB1 bacterium]MCB9502195.1 hypothetical protein [Deferribacteres bacterium]
MKIKWIGYLLFTVGVLGGSLISVLEVLAVQWGNFIALIVIALLGIFIVRREINKESTHEGKLAGNIQDISESLEKIVAEVKAINSSGEDANPYEIHKKIDDNLPDYFETFVKARESIGHVYGLQAYAEVMSSFAAGERYINRVWSASADGYIDESLEYLNRAEEQFADAREKFKALK